jgi:hypothetical protein
MKYNAKAMKEARNLIAYAKKRSANFQVDMTGLLVGYKYKDTVYAANEMLYEEMKDTDKTVYFDPRQINKNWRNAILRIDKHIVPRIRKDWELDLNVYHFRGPLVMIPLIAMKEVLGGNLPWFLVLLFDEWTALQFTKFDS